MTMPNHAFGSGVTGAWRVRANCRACDEIRTIELAASLTLPLRIAPTSAGTAMPISTSTTTSTISSSIAVKPPRRRSRSIRMLTTLPAGDVVGGAGLLVGALRPDAEAGGAVDVGAEIDVQRILPG